MLLIPSLPFISSDSKLERGQVSSGFITAVDLPQRKVFIQPATARHNMAWTATWEEFDAK
jgi:hypothetical protein